MTESLDFSEKYTLGKMLGKGALGKVFLCNDATGSKYAVKIIDKTNKKYERVHNEIDLIKSFSSRYIISFVDSIEDDNRIYFVQEYCPMGSLEKIIKNVGNFNVRSTIKIIKQLVSGVMYLHENLVIHRDLKIANILLAPDGRIRIIDFDLSIKLKDVNELVKGDMGTPKYMAPEVLKREYYSFPVDIWAIGIIIYLLLLDTTPFEGENLEETFINIRTFDFSHPHCYYDLSPKFKNIIDGILILEPNKRLHLGKIFKLISLCGQ